MSIGFWQIAIVVVLVVLLFGRGKISGLMGDVAKGIKSFRKGMKDPEQDQSETISSQETSKTESTSNEDPNSEKKQSIMPQIGWFEIIIIFILFIIIIGPKEFPVILKKMGRWIGSIKKYFNEIQSDVADIHNTVEDEISIEKKYSNINKDKKKDE